MVGGEDTGRALYAVLDVAPDATAEEVKRAYRRLALEYHPDKRKGGDQESTDKFTKFAFAYEVLGDAQRRKRYDLTGEVPQSDAALGRRAASETFFAEYVKSAPKVFRAVTQSDMSLHNLDNYEILEVEGTGVPDYMRKIVMTGLGYLVAVVERMEDKEVVLLRHFVMDQMYVLLAYEPPLDTSAFEERGYAITYWDDPLQSGINASWSDTNRLDKAGHRISNDLSAMKTIDAETIEQRRLVAIEWRGGASAVAAAAAKPSATAEAIPDTIPGSGKEPDRVRLGLEALYKKDPDLLSQSVHQLRRSLEKLLALRMNDMDTWGPSMLCGLAMEVLEDAEDASGGDGGAHQFSDDDY